MERNESGHVLSHNSTRQKMSKQSFTDSYRPAALEFQTSTETASSSSTFTLPYTPVISNDGHTVYAQPQQAYPNAQIQPQVNGTGKKRKLPGVFDEEIAAGAADRYVSRFLHSQT